MLIYINGAKTAQNSQAAVYFLDANNLHRCKEVTDKEHSYENVLFNMCKTKNDKIYFMPNTSSAKNCVTISLVCPPRIKTAVLSFS